MREIGTATSQAVGNGPLVGAKAQRRTLAARAPAELQHEPT